MIEQIRNRFDHRTQKKEESREKLNDLKLIAEKLEEGSLPGMSDIEIYRRHFDEAADYLRSINESPSVLLGLPGFLRQPADIFPNNHTARVRILWRYVRDIGVLEQSFHLKEMDISNEDDVDELLDPDSGAIQISGIFIASEGFNISSQRDW